MAKKKINLDDIEAGAKKATSKTPKKDLRVVSDLTEIAPAKPKTVPPEVRNQQELMDRTDAAIDRVKKDIKENVMDPMKEKLIAQAEQQAIDENTETVSKKKTKKSVEVDPVDAMLKIDDSDDIDDIVSAKLPGQQLREELANTKIDFSNLPSEDEEADALLEELEEEEDIHEDLSKLTEEEEEALRKHDEVVFNRYREDLKDALKTSGRIESEGGKLRVSNASISITKALKQANARVANTASFPLIHSGRMITLESLTGQEIPALDYSSYNSEAEANRAMYSLIYKKDVSPNKPASFEAWLKSIAEWDVHNLYMGLYIATFKDSNYVSYTCNDCHNMFIREVPIEKMYRKHPDASKDFDEKVKKIIDLGNNAVPDISEARFVRISKDYALGLKIPSIFTTTFETSAVEPDFRRKHIQALNLSQYVDNVYSIQGEAAIPINFKVDMNNTTKTAKMKIVALEKILATLSTDEAAALVAIITSLQNRAVDRYQFVIPEADCDGIYGPIKNDKGEMMTGKECHAHFDEIVADNRGAEVTPLDLLFTRHRLTMFAYYETEL